MRVLVISNMYPSSFSRVEGLFVHQQVKELQRPGCEVKVIVPVQWAPFPIKHLSREWKAYSEIPERMLWEGIEVHYPRYLAFPRNLFLASSGERVYWGTRGLVARLYKDFKFDVIHAHVALPCGFAAVMLKRIYKKPVVVTIHGADLQQTIHRNAKCKRALVKVFDRADRIATVSTKLDNIAKTHVGFPEKLVVINDGIDSEEIASATSALASRYAGYKILLSVSHLIKSKGIDLNMKALSQLVGKYPTLKYLVVGTGTELSSLRQLTRALGLGRHVEFLGELPHQQVME
jgi:glycosyltransferase involved in cell wall biosynthesis